MANYSIRDGDVYGHNYHVYYMLKYTASTFGAFPEPPGLEWREKCLFLDHASMEWWEFDHNQYEIKPNSLTFKPWHRRYIEAYRNAAGTTDRLGDLPYGNVRLLDRAKQPVPIATLGLNLANRNQSDQADAVRTYLKKQGGYLEIEIHDNPGCQLPVRQDKNVERLLIFTVGVTGSPLTRDAEQWWRVNGAQPLGYWQRSFTQTKEKTFAIQGFKRVLPPQS